jgi:hypothetical protein
MKRRIQLLEIVEDRIVQLLLKDKCDPNVELRDQSLYLATYGTMFNEKLTHPPPIPTVLCNRSEFFLSNPRRMG